MSLTSTQIITGLHRALEPLELVNAMWLGGSQALGRSDEWSDIDVQLDVADGRTADAFAAAEAALAALSAIAFRWEVPEPTWHGHGQRLYQLAGAPEHLMIDLCVMQRGSEAPRFDEREIHGEPVVVFDKLGIIRAVPLDRAAHRAALARRLESVRARFGLFRHFPGKELERGHPLDALWRYHQFVLAPLVDVLRARHAPLYHAFGLRYLERDLPGEVCERLRRLAYVAAPGELAGSAREAIAWAQSELDGFDLEAAWRLLDEQADEAIRGRR